MDSFHDYNKAELFARFERSLEEALELYKNMRARLFIFLVLICSNTIVNAQTNVASFFSDGMILHASISFSLEDIEVNLAVHSPTSQNNADRLVKFVYFSMEKPCWLSRMN